MPAKAPALISWNDVKVSSSSGQNARSEPVVGGGGVEDEERDGGDDPVVCIVLDARLRSLILLLPTAAR